MKLRRNFMFWAGLILFFAGFTAIFASINIIDKYGGPGINLTEVNPGKSSLAMMHCYLGLAVFFSGTFISIFGFINKSVSSIKIDGNRIKQLGAVRLKNNSALLDKATVQRNILDSGYSALDEIFFKVNKGTAKILILSDIDNSKISGYLDAVKKERFFSDAVIIKLHFKDLVQKEDVLNLASVRENLPFKNDSGVAVFEGILERDKRLLYIDSHIYIKMIFGKMVGLYTLGMLNDISGKKRKAVQPSPENKISKEKKKYKLSNIKSIFLFLLIVSFFGLVIGLLGLFAILDAEIEVGVTLLSSGTVFFLMFFVPSLFLKRTVTVSEHSVSETGLFRKSFEIKLADAKWQTRSSLTVNGIKISIVIFSDYIFDEKELATYQNGKGKYIIIKETDYNKRIVEKFLGSETKI